MFTHLLRAWSYGRRIATAYNRHLGGLMAAAVSFYGLLSIIPLLSVAVAVLGWIVGGPDQALARIKEVLGDYLPASETVLLDTLAEIKRESGLLGLLGLAGLLISASAIYTHLEVAFNQTWDVPVPRSWLRQRLVAIGTSLLTLALLLTTIAITSLLTFLQRFRIPGTGIRAEYIPFLWHIAGYIVPLCLSVMMFALLYKIIPNRPIRWREALAGGLFAGSAWELSKHLFALYLSHFGNYSRVYGSLGGIVILMVWTFYSSMILFLGAEIAADYGRGKGTKG
jgi:membrane protein